MGFQPASKDVIPVGIQAYYGLGDWFRDADGKEQVFGLSSLELVE